jgi:predicted metal-dependent peptidase
MDLTDRIKRANIRLLMTNAFFGTLLLRMKIVEVQKGTLACDTMATDGRSIFFCASYVEGLDDLKLQGLMAHETMHVALSHQLRRGARDPMKWNIACDAAIDHLLKDAGLDVPDSFADMKMWDWAKGLSAEEIYDRMPDSGGSGEGGSGEGGGNRPGAVLDSPNVDSPAAAAEEEAQTQIAVKQAAMAEKSQRGTLPAWMKALVDDICLPKVRWQDHLRMFVANHMPAGQTWARPNRRFCYQGLYLPGSLKEGIGEGVIFFDTSGSTMSSWAQFIGECRSILEDCVPERTHVVQCDAGVKEIRTYEQGEDIGLEVTGGGGSDFRPAFDAVEEARIQPKWAVVLSDMEIAFPEHAPEYPVLFISTTKHPGPDWGDTVFID